MTINHRGEPMIDINFIYWVLTRRITVEFMILLSWALLYHYGLWPDEMRDRLQAIADKRLKEILPWDSKPDSVAFVTWIPEQIRNLGQDKIEALRMFLRHWFKLCFKSDSYCVSKSLEKGLLLRSKKDGARFDKFFNEENAGILIGVNRSEQKKLYQEYGFDSFYQVDRDTNSTVKTEVFMLIGPMSLVNHDGSSFARLFHIEDNGRSLLINMETEQYIHKMAAIDEQDDDLWIRSFTPIKVRRTELDNSRLTPEEIADGRVLADRDYKHTWNAEHNFTRIWRRYVVRGALIKDPTFHQFVVGEEITFKYHSDGPQEYGQSVMGCSHIINPKRKRNNDEE